MPVTGAPATYYMSSVLKNDYGCWAHRGGCKVRDWILERNVYRTTDCPNVNVHSCDDKQVSELGLCLTHYRELTGHDTTD